MNLVVGATGFLGGAICHGLIAKGQPVRALVRETSDQTALDSLRNAGVEIVYGDLKDQNSLQSACQGVTSVLSTATTARSRQPGDSIEATDHAGQLRLVDAARAAGVQHFVYISYSGNLDTDAPLTTAKRAVEQHLQASGMSYTILRPSYFMEGWLGPALGFDIAGGKVQIFGSGQNKISWISLGDVARCAVESVDNPATRNRIIELGGPEALSPLEVVRLCEEVSGRSFEVQHVPEEALRAQYAGASDSLQKSFTALMLDYVEGDIVDTSQALATFPGAFTSVREYVSRTLAS